MNRKQMETGTENRLKMTVDENQAANLILGTDFQEAIECLAANEPAVSSASEENNDLQYGKFQTGSKPASQSTLSVAQRRNHE